MPNLIDADGLQTKTQSDYITEFTAAFESIYGADINLDQDTPDGQMMMIFIQATLDVLDLLTQVYNMMDPDNAIGNVLDQRVAINGIQRQAGTYTITNVTVVNSQSVNLYGLDQEVQDIYTVSDNAGTEWKLQTTQLGLSAGTHVLAFRAADPGETLTTPNTITVPVTIVLGVDSVNNPTTYTTLGINEETDAELRLRRQRSVAIVSQGFLESLLAALENINGLESAYIYENTTAVTDGDGVPGHSIWVIVSGSAADEDIAEAIYQKRNAGCGMFGDISYIITQVDGTPFIVKWDIVESEDLYIEFDASSLDGVNPIDPAVIKAGLVELLVPTTYQQMNINELASIVQQIDANCLVTNAGFSLSGAGPWTNTLTPSAKNKKFTVDAANIAITLV